MKKIFLFTTLVFFLKTEKSFSQYTEIINSNRPGISSGSFSVGKNIIQIENGIYYSNEEHNLLDYEADGVGINYRLRYGLFSEKLEFILEGNYQYDNFNDNRYTPTNTFERNNFKKFKFGAKYLIYDPKKGKEDKPNLYSYWDNRKFKWKNLIPAVSSYIGINFDSKNNPYTNPKINGISPSIAIFTQSNFTTKSVLITNFILERIGTSQNDFEYIICLTHAFNRSIIGFFEKHGIKSDFYADNKVSFGFAYLYNDNLQFDIGNTFNFKETPKIFYLNLGISYRYDLTKNYD